jgi:hypothetical protein
MKVRTILVCALYLIKYGISRFATWKVKIKIRIVLQNRTVLVAHVNSPLFVLLFVLVFAQGTLTEGECSVQLTPLY